MNFRKICLVSDNHPDPLFLEALLQKGYSLALHQTVSAHQALREWLMSQDTERVRRFETDISTLFVEFKKHYDHLNLYIKSFSPIESKPFLEITEDDFHHENLWNWKDAFFGICEAVRYFSEHPGGGAIILIASSDQKLTRSGRVLSGTLSAALSKLTQYAGAELGQYGVCTNCVAVGKRTSDTPWELPSGTVLCTEELASTVLFLASASSLTGNTLFLDGGESLLDEVPSRYGLAQERQSIREGEWE